MSIKTAVVLVKGKVMKRKWKVRDSLLSQHKKFSSQIPYEANLKLMSEYVNMCYCDVTERDDKRGQSFTNRGSICINRKDWLILLVPA